MASGITEIHPQGYHNTHAAPGKPMDDITPDILGQNQRIASP
jgi:hypothetical protein